MKVALVYDRVNKWGGAERVLLSLHKLFPKAPLYTSLYHLKKTPWAKVFPKVVPSFLNKINFLRDKHELVPFLMPMAFGSFNFDDYDLVVSVTSEFAKSIKVNGKTKHICYCLTPTRYLWSGYNTYFKGPTFKGMVKPITDYLRTWDKKSARKPDIFIAISKEVQKRIKKYYKRDSQVIHPPVVIKNIKSKRKSLGDYFLVVSRLEPYKKIELAIEAFNQLNYPLLVVGVGSQLVKLKKLAMGNIKFSGFVSDKKLIDIYKKSKALIMPQEEDFGLVSLESQAMGVPVIAFKKGGSIDTIIDGETGIFFAKQTVDSLTDAIKRFDTIKFKHQDMISNVKRFSEKRFHAEFMKLISEL